MITDIIYSAGWLDGEGGFGLNKQFRAGMICGYDYTPRIALANSDKKAVKKVLDSLGFINKKIYEYQRNGKPVFYAYICSFKDVLRACCLLENYLITKKEHCLLLKEFCINRLRKKRKKIRAIPYDERDHQIYRKLREINIKGGN